MKKALIIIGAILALCIVGAAGFWGGMKYQEKQVDQVRANFENARGPMPGGGEFPQGGDFQGEGDFQNPQAQGFVGRGGGVSGQVKTVDDNMITISTAEDVTTVNLSEATRIQQTVSLPVSELQPGMRVMVIGEKDEAGEVNAVQIMILDDAMPLPGDPASSEKAP
jgi:hypothetical protein